jgi:wyosine [tRNA(Phe)-imidazoG37] synthetase (radical SAM superfamily)
MGTFLFDKIIFGPVNSRRLGASLGVNLLPTNSKICNFDCIYCECGLTDSTKGDLPSRNQVAEELEEYLKESVSIGRTIDAITFAGNGEPTIHKDFAGIIEDTYHLRNTYFPKAQIALLTNSTTVGSKKIRQTFKLIDQVILKLDSVNKQTVELLNCPLGSFNLEKTIELLASLENPIVQTMFVQGIYRNKTINNTTEEEIIPWLQALDKIKPSLVMIYTIARDTPFNTLSKVPLEKLNEIGKRVEDLGFEIQISG